VLALALVAVAFLGAAFALVVALVVFTVFAVLVFLTGALVADVCFFVLAGLDAGLRLTARGGVFSGALVLAVLARRAVSFVLISSASDSIRVVSC